MALENKKVLVVEDEEAHREAIVRSIEKTQMYSVISTEALKGVREQIANGKPDIILADINLQDGKSLDLLNDFPDIPIIIMTSCGSEDIAVQSIKGGAIDYIVKSAETFINLPRILERNFKQISLTQEKEKALQELRKSEEQNRFLVENTIDLIYSIDEEGRILSVNHSFCEFWKKTPENLVGESLAALFNTNENKALICEKIQEAVQTRKSIRFNQEINEFDDKRYVHSVNLEPLFDEKNGIICMTCTNHDITLLKEAEEQIMHAKIKAEEANEVKSQFLANMSHEIRNPLNGIIGITELLLMSESDESQRELMHLIKRSADSLLRIINDVLDYAKIEANLLKLEESSFNINEVVQEVYELFNISAKQKGLKMNVEIKFEKNQGKVIGLFI